MEPSEQGTWKVSWERWAFEGPAKDWILLNGPKNLLMGFKEDSDVWIYLVKVDFWDAVWSDWLHVIKSGTRETVWMRRVDHGLDWVVVMKEERNEGL